MIVNSRREINPDADEVELEQLRLRYRLTAQAADVYYEAGFSMVVQTVNEILARLDEGEMNIIDESTRRELYRNG